MTTLNRRHDDGGLSRNEEGGGISVIQQFGQDIRNIIIGAKLAYNKLMDKRSPQHEVEKYIEDNYGDVMEKSSLGAGSTCNSLLDIDNNILVGATFIERTGYLSFTHHDDTEKARVRILHEIVFIVKLVNEGYKGEVPKSVYTKDIFTPHHIKMLEQAGIVMSLIVDEHKERAVMLSKATTIKTPENNSVSG